MRFLSLARRNRSFMYHLRKFRFSYFRCIPPILFVDSFLYFCKEIRLTGTAYYTGVRRLWNLSFFLFVL